MLCCMQVPFGLTMAWTFLSAISDTENTTGTGADFTGQSLHWYWGYRDGMTIHINLKVLSSILYLALFPFWCSSACSSFRNGGGRPSWLAMLTNGTKHTVTASVSLSEEEELWWGREDGLAWWAAPQEATTTASTCPPGTGRQSSPPPCRGLIQGVAKPAM